MDKDFLRKWTILFDSIKSKSIDNEKNLIIDGPEYLFHKDQHGNTLMHYCAKNNKADIAERLLKYELDKKNFEYQSHLLNSLSNKNNTFDDTESESETDSENGESDRRNNASSGRCHKAMEYLQGKLIKIARPSVNELSSSKKNNKAKELKNDQQLLIKNNEDMTPVHYAILNFTKSSDKTKNVLTVFLDHMELVYSEIKKQKTKSLDNATVHIYNFAYNSLMLAEKNYDLNPLLESITRRKEDGIIMVLDHALLKIEEELGNVDQDRKIPRDYSSIDLYKFMNRLFNKTDKQKRNIFHFCGLYGCHKLLTKLEEFLSHQPANKKKFNKIEGLRFDETKSTFRDFILSLDSNNNLPIHNATSNGSIRCLQTMLDHLKERSNADNIQDFLDNHLDGDNSRMINLAIRSNTIEVVNLLLTKYEASPNIMHNNSSNIKFDNNFPLLEAAKSKPDILKCLLDNKKIKTDDIHSSRGMHTALHIAAYQSPQIIDILHKWTFQTPMETPTKFNQLFRDNDKGYSPLHSAVLSGKTDSVIKIVKYFRKYDQEKSQNRYCELTSNSRNVLHLLAEKINNDKKDYMEIANILLDSDYLIERTRAAHVPGFPVT